MNANPLEVLLVEDNLDDVMLTLRALKKLNFIDRVLVVSAAPISLNYLPRG